MTNRMLALCVVYGSPLLMQAAFLRTPRADVTLEELGATLRAGTTAYELERTMLVRELA